MFLIIFQRNIKRMGYMFAIKLTSFRKSERKKEFKESYSFKTSFVNKKILWIDPLDLHMTIKFTRYF